MVQGDKVIITPPTSAQRTIQVFSTIMIYDDDDDDEDEDDD